MKMESSLSAAEHRRWLRRHLEYPFSFFTERFAGFVIGPVFYVIHHTEYEYDRRFNSPKNAALGFIQKADCGCQLRFITFRGVLCPSQFLLLFFATFVICLLSKPQVISMPVFLGILLAVELIYALVYALIESCSPRSEDSRDKLLSLLSGKDDV